MREFRTTGGKNSQNDSMSLRHARAKDARAEAAHVDGDGPAAGAEASAEASGANHLSSLAAFRHLIREAPVLLELEADTVTDAVDKLIAALVARDTLTAEQGEALFAAAMEREADQSTALGAGVVLPHAFLDDLDRTCLAVARLARPLDLGAPDGSPSQFVFLLCGGRTGASSHLETLMSVARLTADTTFMAAAYEASEPKAWFAAVEAYVARATSPPEAPPVAREDGLGATGFMGGVIADVRRRVPHYASDFRDGLHGKSVAATLFLFFACIAPAVAFGGLMAQLTGGAIGAMEMIVATAIGGTLYALCAGQPLTILGGTGPLLVFTGVLFDQCGRMNLPFLPVYAWVGLWTGAFTVIAAVTNASALIRFCTRFTDEIFALLISVIFIYEATKNVLGVFSNEAVTDHSALMSLVLALSTFYVALSLRNMRASRYLRQRVREFLADFGSVIAIGAATAVAVFLHEEGLPALAVPDTFATTSGRPWLVEIWAVPTWVIVGSMAPALLCTVLVYLDQNITARLVNQSGHRLTKGAAYHHDLLVVGLLLGAFSLFGLPWLVAATVRSLNHIRALAHIEEGVLGDGSRHATITGVQENRLTGLAIHVLIGASVFVLPWMTRIGVEIPMAVLFGLFMFMGVTSLGGNQLFDRVKLWLMDPALHPRTHYVRQVPIAKIHAFTAIQLAGLAILWVVKASALALLFPLFIGLLVPLRLLLNRLFEHRHLTALDSEEEADEGPLHETEQLI